MKKALSLFLCTVMLLGLALPFGSVFVSAETLSPSTDYDAILESVYDADTNTYTLTTADHLLALGYAIAADKGTTYTGSTFALGADITVNEGLQDAIAAGATTDLIRYPDTKGKTFQSHIDGRGHTISGLYMTATSAASTGFFGYAKEIDHLVVKDLAIVDSYASSSKATFGGIFGQTNLVTTDPDKGLHMSNLYLDIDIVSTLAGDTSTGNTGSSTGTVIGSARSSMVRMDSVVSVGNVTVDYTRYVGGLIGQITGGDGFDVSMTNCAYYGTISGSSKEYGLMVGRLNPTKEGMSDLTMENCVAGGTMTTTSTNGNHGAFLGYSSMAVIPTVNLNDNLYVAYNDGTINTHKGASGFVPNTAGTVKVTAAELTGSAGRTTLANNGFDGWLVADFALPMPAGTFEVRYDPTTDYAAILSALLDGSTYTVSTKNQLLAFGYALKNGTTFSGQTVALGANITLNEGVQTAVAAGNTSALTKWPSPQGKSFYGNIDGNGYAISGMYMTATASSTGFFGYGKGTDNTTNFVRDLAILDSYASNTKAIFGGIFGQTNYVNTTAAGVAKNQKLVLENLYLDIDLNCTLANTGDDVSPTQGSFGSLIGTARSTTVDINSVVSVGNITVNDTRYIGGLIGQVSGGDGSNATITNSAYYGTIANAAKEVGLLVGRLNPTGVASTLSISHCVAGGTVTNATSPSISGAFLGYSSSSVSPVVSFENNLYVTYMTQGETEYDTLYTGTTAVVPTETNNVHTTVSALTGKEAATLLTDNGFTAWSAQVDGKVIPTTVRDLWFPTTNTKFVGYQLSEAEGGFFTIRLIGVVDALNYGAVGFKISLSCEDPMIGVKNHTQKIYTVYNTLTAIEKTGTVEYSADQLGGNYIFALNINNVPVGCGNIDFLVRTFHKSEELTNYDGRTMAFTVDSSFADLSETPTGGESTDAPDFVEGEIVDPETNETRYTDIGYRGLDVTVTPNATIFDYDDCITALEADGYTLISERVTAYNHFAQLDKGEESLWVSYYGTKKQLRVSTDGQLLTLPEKETVASPVAATVTQYANYASQMEDQSVAPGMGYVIKADNGKLIVIDGAHEEDRDGFYALMQEVYGAEHPVIAAWIFTHAHNDHIEGAAKILETYGDAMTVEAVYSSFLSMEYNNLDTGNAEAIAIDLPALFTQIDRLEIPTVTLRTGMQFYVGGVLTSILFASDDLIYPNAPSVSSLNEHSLIFTVEYAGETVLFLGDAISKAEQTCTSNWSDREWDAEVCQVAHHGIQGVSSNLYKKINPKVLFWTCNMVRYNYNYSRFEYIIYLHSLDVKNVIAYDGTATLTFGQFVS